MGQKFTGGAIGLELVGSMSAVSPGAEDTFIVNAAATGWPDLVGGAGDTAVALLDRDQDTEEKVLIKAISGTTWTVAERGYDGTTPAAHDNGCTIEHVPDAESFQRFQDHLDDTTDAHPASAIAYDGAPAVSATNVEDALDELASEKQASLIAPTGLAATSVLGALNELALEKADLAEFTFASYTPTLKQDVTTIACSTEMGSYIQIGKLVIGHAYLVASGAGSAGGVIYVGLPVAADYAAGIIGVVGNHLFFDQGAAVFYTGAMALLDADEAILYCDGGSSGLGASPSLGIAAGDVVRISFMYEAA